MKNDTRLKWKWKLGIMNSNLEVMWKNKDFDEGIFLGKENNV